MDLVVEVVRRACECAGNESREKMEKRSISSLCFIRCKGNYSLLVLLVKYMLINSGICVGWVDLLENYYILAVSMARKEREKRSPLAAAMGNIFHEGNKPKRRDTRSPSKISSFEVVFDKSKVEIAEEGKKLTPEEKYFQQSSLGRILDMVDDEVPLSLIKSVLKKQGIDGIQIFLNVGVLTESGIDRAVTHREKLRDYFKDTEAAMVLYVCMKNEGITPLNATTILPMKESKISIERRMLMKAGFLEKRKPYDREIIVPTKYSKELGIETWGMEEKIEKLRREKGQEAGI